MKNGIEKLENNFYLSNSKNDETKLNEVIDELYNSKFNKKYVVSSKEYIKNENSIIKQEKLLVEFNKKILIKKNTNQIFYSENKINFKKLKNN